MFTYNTRTEIKNGARFIEKDVILLDYVYADDVLLQVNASLQTPGFGFVIKEYDDESMQVADNVVLITFSNDNSYRVILKNGIDQTTAVNQFIESATTLYGDDVTLFFKKHNDTLSVYKAIPQGNGNYYEIRLMSYRMAHDMGQYRIGIYSNGGNTVRTAAVQTLAPSNWVTNVFNAGGGRIIWIKNGFTIDEAEYDVEAESIDIPMKAGTYWFDYQTTNPDIKAYIYETRRKDTATKRSRDEILGTKTGINTMIDEEKNILGKNGSFTLSQDHAINIKFKGKWGTVTDICIKQDKQAPFVATGYGTIIRPGSQIVFDLERIKAFRFKAILQSVPQADIGELRKYQLFQSGAAKIGIHDPVTLQTEQTYEFSLDTRIVTVNGVPYFTVPDTETKLTAFKNVTAVITELVVTQTDGTEFYILLQKTTKTLISSGITSPILVVGPDKEPLDLSSSYRQVAETQRITEWFNAINGIHLLHYPDIASPYVMIYGIPANTTIMNRQATDIQNIAKRYEKISYVLNTSDLLQKSIKIPYQIRARYKYIVVIYQAIMDYRYEFTNWERELFDLSESKRLYLHTTPASSDDLMVYGIPDLDVFNDDLLYYIPDKRMENSIAMCAGIYDNITTQIRGINMLGRLMVDADILNKYRYIIVDYLKQDSYTVNQRKNNYEIDISTAHSKVQILYDSKDGKVTETYRVLNFAKMTQDTDAYEVENNDFIVLGDKP